MASNIQIMHRKSFRNFMKLKSETGYGSVKPLDLLLLGPGSFILIFPLHLFNEPLALCSLPHPHHHYALIVALVRKRALQGRQNCKVRQASFSWMLQYRDKRAFLDVQRLFSLIVWPLGERTGRERLFWTDAHSLVTILQQLKYMKLNTCSNSFLYIFIPQKRDLVDVGLINVFTSFPRRTLAWMTMMTDRDCGRNQRGGSHSLTANQARWNTSLI